MYSKIPIICGPWHGRRFATYKPLRHGSTHLLPCFGSMPEGIADVLETTAADGIVVKVHQFNISDESPVFIAAPENMTTRDVFLALLEPLERQYDTYLAGR